MQTSRIKKHTPPFFLAKQIHVENTQHRLRIEWSDGHESILPIQRLRGYCPCALCQGHEGTRVQYIDNQAVALFAAEPVGRYALLLKFSDGHSTGIFRYDTLRRLDPAEESRWGPPELLKQASLSAT